MEALENRDCPAPVTVTLDFDSTYVFSRSVRRQGVDRTYKKGYALHPLLCFDAASGVFARIVKEDLSKFKPDDPFAAMVEDTLGVSFSADKAGGFATPNLGVSTLTRSLGPLAGRIEDAVTGTFDPAKFFPKGLATLFGTLTLKSRTS